MLKKKILSLISCVTLIILTMSSVAYAKTDTTQSIQPSYSKVESANDYETWLKGKTNDSDAKKVLTKYQNLTKEQKDKFVGYLKDGKLFANAFSTPLKPGESKSLANGDVIVTLTETNEPINIASKNFSIMSTVEYRKATYQRYVTLFGVKILQTTSYVNYSHDGTSIIDIQGSRHWTSINYNPLLMSEWGDEPTEWDDGTTAYSTNDVTFGAMIEGYGIQYGSAELGVWGDVDNDAGGWLESY
ncbi:hypothetical protein UF75_3629 [Desulfosporosinus sp. I2]|uniref:hypothetical protein n=1 Tax=Desulfosporosinus sp. I2 TaxID=1617025 RepID=UPI0005EF0D3F|nr:hypothetical protein [Desulfosporosinus sp. I2]KJR45964.1 hypothetical protein UF75_3629 [Desulfosporosinus sp. I2]